MFAYSLRLVFLGMEVKWKLISRKVSLHDFDVSFGLMQSFPKKRANSCAFSLGIHNLVLDSLSES